MKIQLRSKAPDDAIEGMLGRRADPSHAALRIAGDASVYKPNGEPLLFLLKGGVSQQVADAAYPFLHWLRRAITTNRAAYAGSGRVPTVLKDGSISKTTIAAPSRSCIVGYMDRYPRRPFCRPCALSSKRPEEWASCLPLIEEVARAFERTVPHRYHAQLEAASVTHPAYVIPGTPFTTLTVNNTTSAGYHRDAGDFKRGFGAMLVLRRGAYRGCDLVVPAFGVSVDLEDRDLIFFDVHEIHGNTPFYDVHGPICEPEKGGYERISVVLYFRERMTECLAPEQELERAKSLGVLTLDEETHTP